MWRIGLMVVVACGTTSDGYDAGSGSDAGRPRDGGVTAGNVDCSKSRTRDVTLANGTRTSTQTFFALLDISPGSDFRIEQCDCPFFNTPDFCSEGATCTNTGALPTIKCTWTNGIGQFTADGKLIIQCGAVSTSFDASGAVIATSDTRCGTIRVHR